MMFLVIDCRRGKGFVLALALYHEVLDMRGIKTRKLELFLIKEDFEICKGPQTLKWIGIKLKNWRLCWVKVGRV